jgi:hypothetical protein
VFNVQLGDTLLLKEMDDCTLLFQSRQAVQVSFFYHHDSRHLSMVNMLKKACRRRRIRAETAV